MKFDRITLIALRMLLIVIHTNNRFFDSFHYKIRIYSCFCWPRGAPVPNVTLLKLAPVSIPKHFTILYYIFCK